MTSTGVTTGDGAADGSQHHCHITSGATADQAADAEAGKTADDSANPRMVIAWQLHQRDLFDRAATDFEFSGLLSRDSTRGQEQGER